MDCTLLIPHLLPPPTQADVLWHTVDAPQLKRLLARALMSSNATLNTEAWLCRAFGVARQQDFPLAPILAAHEKLNASSGYWLNATPVHLETRRNALVLTDPAALEISVEESVAFAATLAAHLHEENVALHTPGCARWFLRSDAIPVMTTSSLATVTGRDVRPFLPQGTDSARWHRILTELQMLLHVHPLNDAREARGLLPVNSVWLWGGGTLPTATAVHFATVWSDNLLVRALGQHAGCRLEALPARIAPESLREGAHLFSMDRLQTLLRTGDMQAWSRAVTAHNRDWITPLLGALKTRCLQSLKLVSVSDDSTQEFMIRPVDLMKFWRKNKYLQ